MRFSDRTSNWIAGFALGGFVALMLGILPPVGLIMIAAFLLPALRSRAPLAAAAGLLVGTPLFWLVLIGRAALACRQFDAQPGQECIGPDLTGWSIVAGVLLVAGVVLTWRGAARR